MYLNKTEYDMAIKQAKFVVDLRDWESGSAWINILGTMLFPDEKNKRLSWIFRMFLCTRAANFQQAIKDKKMSANEASNATGKDFAALALYTDGPDELASILFGAQSNNIEIEGESRIDHGLIAGKVFLLALHSNKSLREIISAYYSENKKISVSERSILRILWPQYLPMVHYWAAMVTFLAHDGVNFDERITNPDDFFHCQQFKDKRVADGLSGLVRLAESYLFQGINDVPKRQGPKRPLLDISKMCFVMHPFLNFSALYAK